jgi:2-polyprenyl-3-methyl-5-hydroxy-6-metoxy-1,4-benzoquinol methylase
MLNRDTERLPDYRQALYANYRAMHYGFLNPEQGPDRTPEFEADYEGFLPENRDVRILDIGCGMGHFLRFLQSKGYRRSVGVDVSPDQVSFCRAHGLENAEHVENVFHYLETQAQSFDLVTMNDVIEHFNKDEIVHLLALTRNALTDRGRLVIRTPNIAGMCGPYARYIDFTHEIAFSEQSLKQVLLAAGFQDVIVRGSRVAFLLRPKRMLFLLARRIWFALLKLMYTLEVGTDRPVIYEKNLIASGLKA